MIDVKIDSESKRVLVSVDHIDENIRRGIRQALYFSGKSIIKDLRAEFLRKPRSGRVYTSRDRAGRKRRHVASQPGETAANWTGKMRKGSDFKVRGFSEMDMVYENVEYAEWVEDGTSKMKPRPGMKIAIDKNERNIENYFHQEINKALA